MLSLQQKLMFGSSTSLLDFMELGSVASIRTFARIGSSVSIWGQKYDRTSTAIDHDQTQTIVRVGTAFSLLDSEFLNSTLSVR